MRNKPIIDEENPAQRIDTHFSESNVLQSVEAGRRLKNQEEVYPSPKHANTMPAAPRSKAPMFAPIQEGKDVASNEQSSLENGRQKEDSQDSGTYSSETAVASEIQSNGNTRRRRFPNLFKKKTEGGETDVEKPKKRASMLGKETQKFTLWGQLRATLFNSWINVLLIFVPIGIGVNYSTIPRVGVFIINFIAIIPLAAMLSYATEEIALRVGETIGGLLNATFG